MKFVIKSDVFIKDYDIDKVNELIRKHNSGFALSGSEIEVILNYYISLTRKKMEEFFSINVSEDPLINKCDFAQKTVFDLMTKDGFLVYPKESQNVIHPNCMGHSFLVFCLDGKSYLIDPTFKQFFLSDECDFDKLIVVDGIIVKSLPPGYFLVRSEFGKMISSKLISDGFIELDDKVAGEYCNSFYFGKTGRDPFNKIPGSVYFNALAKPSFYCSLSDEKFNTLYGDGFSR